MQSRCLQGKLTCKAGACKESRHANHYNTHSQESKQTESLICISLKSSHPLETRLYPHTFFFCVPSCISGVHHSSSSVSPAVSLGFTILLLLCPQLYLWGSSFFFFFCVPSCISGAHHSSSSVSPAVSLGFTILLLLLCPQLYLWGSPFFFFCVPSCISGVHHSSSSVFPAVSLGLIILLLLCPQLYL